MDCNAISVQFIEMYARFSDIGASWALAALGFTVGNVTLGNITKRDVTVETPASTSWPITELCRLPTVVFLSLSLLSYYFANNALGQSVPEICSLHLIPDKGAHLFVTSNKFMSILSDGSKYATISIAALRCQYIFLAIGICGIVLPMFRNDVRQLIKGIRNHRSK